MEEGRESEVSEDKTPYSVVVKKGIRGGHGNDQRFSQPEVLAADNQVPGVLRENKILKVRGQRPWKMDRRKRAMTT